MSVALCVYPQKKDEVKKILRSIKNSPKLMLALDQAVKNLVSVSELENYGCHYRAISILENSEHEIIFIRDLVSLKLNLICQIPGFGVKFQVDTFKALKDFLGNKKPKKRLKCIS